MDLGWSDKLPPYLPDTAEARAAAEGPQQQRPIDLETALGRLAPVTRAVLWLHDVEGYTHEEIGGLLEIAVGTSKSQLSRARRTLRALLGSRSGGKHVPR